MSTGHVVRNGRKVLLDRLSGSVNHGKSSLLLSLLFHGSLVIEAVN